VRLAIEFLFCSHYLYRWLGKTEDGASVAKRRGKMNGRHLFVALKDEIKAELDTGSGRPCPSAGPAHSRIERCAKG
jgi:hypothetical protein